MGAITWSIIMKDREDEDRCEADYAEEYMAGNALDDDRCLSDYAEEYIKEEQ